MQLTIDEAIRKGVEAHKAGDIQEADRYYTAILKVQPKHRDANHNMGVLAVGVGKVEEALPFFKVALEADASVAQYWLSYIDALIKLDRLVDAKAVFDQARGSGFEGDGFDKLEERITSQDQPQSDSQEPSQDKVQPLIELYNQKKLQQVLDAAENLLNQYPYSGVLHNIIGTTNQSLGKLDEAIDAYNKAISINPDYAEAYNNLAATLKKKGNISKSIEAYKMALSIRPDYAHAYSNLGNALKDQGKLNEAIDVYKKAISINPDYSQAYNNMGNALKNQGKLSEAVEVLNVAVAIEPEYADAHNNLSVVLREQGKLQEAIKASKRALSIKPDSAEAYNNMGNTLKDQLKPAEALEAYNSALSIKSDFAEAYNNIGALLNEQGKLEDALLAFEKAIVINPDYADVYNNMGGSLREQGRIDEAIDAFKKVISINPDHESAKHMLSSLSGDTPKTAPKQYVESLFDGYAAKFENSLTGNLGYNIPGLITNLLVELSRSKSLGSVLDLGCGTGLLGSEIKNYCSNLEGVDLSDRMLKIADQKKVYSNLSKIDIVEYLSSHQLSFDYFIALDVFIYVGDLYEIFRLIKSKNKKPGKLVFSTEHTEKDGYHLLQTGRYSHSKSYIESLCREFGYEISHFSISDLRKERKVYLEGGIYILEFIP